MSFWLRLAPALLVLAVLACGPQDATAPPPAVPVQAPILAVARAEAEPAVAEPMPVEDPDPGPIPVSARDPWRGSVDAPVTIVEFADFQCPYCARVQATLNQLFRDYGHQKIRIVWKHDPLPFHPNARPASTVAAMLFERFGNAGFWKAHDAFFADREHLADTIEDAASRAGGSLEQLKGTPAWAQADAKVEADIALGKSIGVNGTPAFFINGVYVSGAQPYEKFAAVVDEQLKKAAQAVERGTSARRVYVELTKAQKQAVPWRPPPTPPPPPDTVVHKVAVGTSPVRGKNTALVTIVEWADFQCPFCGRVVPTLKQLAAEYGDKLRFVYKQNPLPFHPRAEPSAELALEARAEKGDKGFWAAHDLLYAKECNGAVASERQACMDAGGTWIDHQTRLEDADLLDYAKTLGLDVGRVKAAIASKKYEAIIRADQDLGEDLSASGTPHFFINGRRLVGAQPIEKFRALIDEELANASALVQKGVPLAKVYDKLQENAKAPVLELERKVIPAPTRANPSRGPARAKVTMQVFGDFQCPYCRRAYATMQELEKAFPGKIRVVWRNLPLTFHKDAELAAEAAMEAFRQKGDAGFWAMATLLYENDAPGMLERPALEQYAAKLGLDAAQFASALDGNLHKAEVDADSKIAADAHITGTPNFVINGYVIVGAQPLAKFKRVVERALAEAK